jgi:hypothetical protein
MSSSEVNFTKAVSITNKFEIMISHEVEGLLSHKVESLFSSEVDKVNEGESLLSSCYIYLLIFCNLLFIVQSPRTLASENNSFLHSGIH